MLIPMKSIEIDEDLYHYIASQTQHIGESASEILRRLLRVDEHPMDGSHDSSVMTGHREQLEKLVASQEFASQSSSVGRFMLLLSYLYQHNPREFSQASQIKGSKRVYFATSEMALLANGKTTKPKIIPSSPFWVITNTNTGRKRLILAQVMQAMGFSESDVELVCHVI